MSMDRWRNVADEVEATTGQPGVDDDELGWALWNLTSFPMGHPDEIEQQLREALSDLPAALDRHNQLLGMGG